MLHLFNCFYDSASSDVLDKFHDPRKCEANDVFEMSDEIFVSRRKIVSYYSPNDF